MKTKMPKRFRAGQVAVVGRPNAGKSTLINALVGQKVSIVTPLPQTTRTALRAAYWDERGQIIFWDTPGLFHHRAPFLSKKINTSLNQSLEIADLALYVIDQNRPRGPEENIILGRIRQFPKPKILVFNKIDIKKPNYRYQYEVFGDEFSTVVSVSALHGTHLKTLIEQIFLRLPLTATPLFEPRQFQAQKSPDLTPKKFIAEIIREKAFLTLRQEVPYVIAANVKQIQEEEKLFRIEAEILTINDRYQKIIIGKNGATLKQIGTLARKEIELITNKQVFLHLAVHSDPHWPERL